MTASGDRDSQDAEALAALAAQGDPRALADLHALCAGDVHRIVHRRVRCDPGAAEDATQETWLRVTRAIGGYRPRDGGVVAWLRTIALNVVIDHHRRTTRHREHVTDGSPGDVDAAHVEGPEDVSIRREAARDVAGAVAGLPEVQRRVIELRFYGGLTVAETAAAVGCSEGAVKQAQVRALARLARCLPRQERDGPPPDHR